MGREEGEVVNWTKRECDVGLESGWCFKFKYDSLRAGMGGVWSLDEAMEWGRCSGGKDV